MNDEQQAQLTAMRPYASPIALVHARSGDHAMDRFARIAATALHVPVAFIARMDGDRPTLAGAIGVPEPWAARGELPPAYTFCREIIAAGIPVAVADARPFPRALFAGSVETFGVAAYAGVPLLHPDGAVAGSLCVVADTRREWLPTEIALLRDLADAASAETGLRAVAVVRERTLDASESVRAEIARERSHLLTLFAETPAMIAMLEGPDHRFTFANARFAQVAGRAYHAIIGRTVAELFAYVAGQSVVALLDQVHATSEPFVGSELLVPYDRHGDGGREDAYFDFVLQPIHDHVGGRTTILVHGVEVTAQVHARRQDARMRAFMEHLSDLVVVVDADGVYQYVSPSHEQVLGFPIETIIGRRAFDFVRPEDRAAVEAWFAAALTDPATPQVCELHVPAADGTLRIYESTLVNRLDDPDVRGLIATSHDITERTRTLAALSESEQRFQNVVTNAPVILFAIDTAGVYTFVAGRGLTTLGFDPEDLVGRNSFVVYRDVPEVIDRMHRALAGEETTATVTLGPVVMQIHFMPLVDARGRVTGVTGVGTDVTERVQAEEALRHQAVHDALTGLPNRQLLQSRLEEALLTLGQEGTTLALLLIDLDHFKEVNDTLGHHYGDVLLRHIASVLREVVRPGDTVARLGGDEFAVVLPATDAEAALTVAHACRAAVTQPVSLNGVVVRAIASVGIALAPAHGINGATLLRHADTAMYTAKRMRQGARVYHEVQGARHEDHLTLASDLHQAIEAGALTMSYQPQVACDDGRLLHVEALTRWVHPTRGPIAPDVFIPLAEENGLITALDVWVLEEALRQCGAWRAAGYPIEVAVNLSIWDLQDDALVTRVTESLARHGLPPSALHIELTESTLMIDAQRTAQMLTRLSERGIGTMIDDFGMGYASFASLRQLPVEALKIDRTFVGGMTHNEMDEAIVRATVGLGKNLGIPVVAEGVENAETWELLRAMACDVAQGYFISPPLPAPDFLRWLAAR